MPISPDTRIDLDRFWSTIEASAEIGKGRPGGLSRLTLSDADREMRDLFCAWCKEAGLDVEVDTAGNIFGRRAGQGDVPVLRARGRGGEGRARRVSHRRSGRRSVGPLPGRHSPAGPAAGG